MTPLEELQHVLFGQLTHGHPTSDLECILDALREAKATGAEECATRLDHEAEDWCDEFAVTFKEAALLCRARAAAIRKGEG